MAFRGVFIKLPEEAIELLDAVAPHVGEVHPARVGRTSVILAMLHKGEWPKTAKNDPRVRDATEAYQKLLDRSLL